MTGEPLDRCAACDTLAGGHRRDASCQPVRESCRPMRLLVAFPECQRQYDASRRRIGSRFRCHCGALVEVRQPQGRGRGWCRVSVLWRPRQEHSQSCSFCHSDFTLHERDLDTVCPQCLARVSDRARFCHHCGIGLVPELDAGAETAFCCPACPDGHALTSRRLGAAKSPCWSAAPVAASAGTGGLSAVGRARRKPPCRRSVPSVPRSRSPAPTTPELPRRHSFYRPCVVCGELMNRVNYGHTNEVIVDFWQGPRDLVRRR